MSNEIPSIKRRLVCLLYEGLVVFSILLIGFLLPQIVFSGFGWTARPAGLWLHVFLLLMAYFVWCWLNGGQTLPMKTWKLRVINADGLPLRPLQAVLRYMLAWPSMLLFGIGILWVVVDKDKQFLHDRIAGTKIGAAN
jgi:uncharacterized RDD family membrane protein YckC